MDELDVLIAQLDELLGEGAVDTSDALEIATCAGLAERMGADPVVLAAAEAWRAGPGGPLLAELWEEADVETLVEDVEGLLGANADEDELEEVFFDFDDLVAAAVWSKKRAVVAKGAQRVAATVRLAPEIFEPLAPYGRQMSRLRAVGEDLGLYDYWLALADAAGN
ncbi:MAG: hypothetical protein H6737_08515 [Alphaproteobacteria bacterium]|nr:hypothetical protein [Alphaproteobacteria bacterium]